MAVTVQWQDADDAVRVVDALLTAARLESIDRPLLARRYERIADDLGDALDALPPPGRTS